MPEKAIVSYDEILSVDTISALMEIYQDKRYTPKNRNEFLAILKRDWALEKNRLYHMACELPVPNKIQSLDVVIDKVKYSIFGISHADDIGDAYVQMITSEMNTKKNLVWEGNITSKFPDIQNGIELGCPSTIPTYILVGKGIKKFHRQILRKLKIKPVPKDNSIAHIRRFNYPVEARWSKQLPAYVEIRLKEEHKHPGYSYTEKMSGFQAEFMKAWKPGEDKNILNGNFHPTEVRYFLNNQIKSQKIVDRAWGLAELLNQGKVDDYEFRKDMLMDKFHNKVELGYNTSLILGGIIFSIVGHALIDLLPK